MLDIRQVGHWVAKIDYSNPPRQARVALYLWMGYRSIKQGSRGPLTSSSSYFNRDRRPMTIMNRSGSKGTVDRSKNEYIFGVDKPLGFDFAKAHLWMS